MSNLKELIKDGAKTECERHYERVANGTVKWRSWTRDEAFWADIEDTDTPYEFYPKPEQLPNPVMGVKSLMKRMEDSRSDTHYPLAATDLAEPIF